jgi:hypothetical protein
MGHHDGNAQPSANIMICSRDWQDLLDGQERIAVAIEELAPILSKLSQALQQQNDDREAMAKLKADIDKHGVLLKGAVDSSPKPAA